MSRNREIPSPANRPRSRKRRGKIIVLTALLLMFMMGMVAFGVDVGYMALTKTEIQTSTDAAALAGAGELVNGTSAAEQAALAYLASNKVGGRTMTSSNATFEYGSWDSNTHTFTVSANTPSALRLTTFNNNQPLFFGRVLGRNTFNTGAQSVATYQPREISLVLDYSGSMAYDSQFRNISLLGQTAVETNLQQIYTQLGSPAFGSLTYTPVAYGNTSTSNSSVKSRFGLTSVAYPYPGGSWDEYIDYVQSDSYVRSAGYRCKYGYLTWVNYLQAIRGSSANTPPLKNCSEQPVTALKDAVDSFLTFLGANSASDRVAVSIYTYSDGTAKLEQGLTHTYSTISSICRARQAGHYVGGTNISAGMTKGRLELQNNSRVGAAKLLVVMTDGVVNLPSGNTNNDKNAVRAEAQLCANAKIPVVTICVGALADTNLMQEVADMTGGVAFVVPGGQPIASVQAQLEAVFVQVASFRPLQLVQ
ncbi:MAG: pilus assembly protein TadG-related protein [Pirellulaceae bacterium]